MLGETHRTERGSLWVPDNKITAPDRERCTFVALRGLAHVLAVIDGGHCIGWTLAEYIGFKSAKAFMESQERLAALARENSRQARLGSSPTHTDDLGCIGDMDYL